MTSTSPQGPIASPPGPIASPEMPDDGLRAADPANQRRRDVTPAGSVLAVMVASLFLAAAINSASMLQRAESGPLGPGRDLSLAIWTPIHGASERLGLTGLRRGLDVLRDRTADDEPGGLVVAGGAVPEGGPVGVPAAAEASPGGSPPTIPDRRTLSDLAGVGLAPADGTTAPAANSTTAPAANSTTTPAANSTAGAPAPGDPEGATPPPSRAPAVPGAPLGPTADAGSPSTTTDPDSPGLRRPTTAEPLRILVVGDSTMDALGAALLRDLEETGVTDAVVDHRVSSGLARPDFFDWPAHLRSLRAETDAELVVLMLGANDAQPFLVDGEPERFGTERWLAAYRDRVADLMTQLTADGDGVVWIGLPVMRNDSYDSDLQQLNRIFAEEVARFQRSIYLEARSVLSDEGGGYTAYLVDGAGDRQRVRQDDGIHLTEAGGAQLSPVVVEAINSLSPLY